MASSSSSSSNAMTLSLKVVLVSAGVLTVAMAMNFSFPLLFNFAVYDLPAIWSALLSWLKPPYLYVVINGIIITIFASSWFHHHNENQSQPLANQSNTPVLAQASFGVSELPEIAIEEPPVVYEVRSPAIGVDTVPVINSDFVRIEEDDEFEISRSTWTPSQRKINSPLPPANLQSELILPVNEKPLVTSRFAHSRKPSKTSPEGARALGVAKRRKHETLENTWKTITDGRHMPLTRHLRKSETFENHHQSPPAAAAKMKKAETFRDRTNYDNQNHRPPTNSSPASGGKMKKEGSLSHDELNRRIEAFIKKFNDDMRQQRQESLSQYTGMMNRGAR